jgi:CHASE3 domain sensor protein
VSGTEPPLSSQACNVVGAVSYRSMIEYSKSDLWVRHTDQVLEKLQDLLAAMQTAEKNARGYLLTGDQSFLEVYRASTAKTREDQSILRNLTADNVGQQGRLDTLATLAARKFQLAEQVISLRRTNGLEAATDALQEGSGKEIMDDFQRLVDQMQDEELRLLALHEQEAKRRLAQTKTVLILGTILGLLITILAGWRVQHDNSESKDSGAKYRGLLEAAPDAMVVVNEGGEIVLLNVQAEKQFGYSRDELLGQKVKSIIPDGFAERPQKRWHSKSARE